MNPFGLDASRLFSYHVRLNPVMPVQYGKCSNRSACSLAYTGEVIRFEGDARCPECGQPLAMAKPPRKSRPWLPGLVVLLFGVVGVTLFFVWQRRAQPEMSLSQNGPMAAPSNNAEARGPALIEGNTTKLPPELVKPPAGEATAPSAGSGTPVVPVNETAEASRSPEASGPAVSPSEEAVVVKPPGLSAQQVDTTRNDVLKRISLMPRLSAQEKDRLAQRVESAHSMERLQIVRFDRGKTTLGRNATDELVRAFNAKDVKDKLSDPTLVIVVAGYADSGGDANTNLRLSEERADTIGKLLKQKAAVLNVIHTVAMGSTELLDSKRPEQNRAVEIWAVVP
jgi:outer membrane protein OmpA-like peptidoglycan-associated protein